MKFRHLLTGFVAMIAIGCDNEDLSPQKLYVKEMTDPKSDEKILFTYENGHLLEYKRVVGGRIPTVINFLYADGQLKKVETTNSGAWGEIIELNYDENGLRKEEKIKIFDDGTLTGSSTRTFHYRDGTLESTIHLSDDPSSFPQEIIYKWENGNLVQMDYYWTAGGERHYSGRRIMTYDDKRNLSNQDIAFVYTPWGLGENATSKNNLIKRVDEDFGNSLLDRGTYTFTYNNAGYPAEYRYSVGSSQFNPVKINY